MKRVLEGNKQAVVAKVWTNDIDIKTEAQIRNMATLPFLFKHLAIMPDAHLGRGSTVGTVIATKGAILPAAVGVDIGCGMCAVKLPFKVNVFGDNLSELRHSIERSIPVGHRGNSKITVTASVAFDKLGSPTQMSSRLYDRARARSQLGSLGGGNHFIEICTDTEGGAWVMLHSGSRNVGKTLADIHIKTAQKLMADFHISLPDRDLAYLPQRSPEFQEYIDDLMWAQDYAKANRNEMMSRVLKDVSFHVYRENKGEKFMTEFRVDCHHNYVAMENHFNENVWVTRKGAVRAREDDYGIIPGSMGAKSFIVRGKGNPQSFCSCSHGAGRKHSRSEAKRLWTQEDVLAQTAGVECRKDEGIIDELPSAYKDIDKVMANQADLVEPIHELKQILCVKG